MLIGLCELIIYLPGCRSLKDKRSVIKSLNNKLRRKYNISISEIGFKNIWKKSMIGVSCLSDSKKIIDGTFDMIIKDIENNGMVELINYQISII